MPTLHVLLILVSIILFVVAAIFTELPKVSLIAAGLAFLAASFLVSG